MVFIGDRVAIYIGFFNLNRDCDVSWTRTLSVLSVDLVMLVLLQGDPLRNELVLLSLDRRIVVVSPSCPPVPVRYLLCNNRVTAAERIRLVHIQFARVVTRHVESVLGSCRWLEEAIPSHTHVLSIKRWCLKHKLVVVLDDWILLSLHASVVRVAAICGIVYF